MDSVWDDEIVLGGQSGQRLWQTGQRARRYPRQQAQVRPVRR